MNMNMETAIQLNDMVVNTLNSFILLKITERGWFTTSQENEVLRDAVLTYICDHCGHNSQEAVLEALAQDQTRDGLAEMIFAKLLSLDPMPNYEGLLTFAEYILKFVQGICSDHYNFVLGISANAGSDGTMLDDQVKSQSRPFPFFNLPAELRNMVYREVLVLPDGGLVRSFTSPALLQTNMVLRAEGTPIFYAENHFEITIKRSPEEMTLAAGKYLPNVDKGIFQHFLRMWPVFNVHGSNCLQYVRHINLIYQLSMDMGYPFGDDIFDKRLGFRFSHDPFEEDLDGNYGEDEQSNAESDSDSSDDESDGDFEELEAEEENIEAQDSTSNGYEYEADTDVEEDPEADFDPVGVFELNRGTFDWRSRDKTYFFLWRQVNEQVRDQLWAIYPIDRLTEMLWRCVRDCPLASENVDFLCDDIQYWLAGNTPFTRYDEDDIFDPDDENAW